MSWVLPPEPHDGSGQLRFAARTGDASSGSAASRSGSASPASSGDPAGPSVPLPSGVGGPVTQTVGWFELDAPAVAAWLSAGIDGASAPVPAGWSSLPDAVAALAPGPVLRRRAVVPVTPGWSLLLTDGPLGTDVGMLPSHAARDLGVRALRTVFAPAANGIYPARCLELYGPGGAPPLLAVRSVAAADDGGRWVFDTFGDPLPFEDLEAYRRRRKADRFTSELLHGYLRALGVPIDVEPDWPGALLVSTA